MLAMAASPGHPCPACGFKVLAAAPGSGQTCPLCAWIDDAVQLAEPDFEVGANVGLSLRQAQRKALAALPLALRNHAGYVRDRAWRPLAPGESPRNAAFGSSSPVCYLESDAVEEIEPYWLDPPPENA
jgi:Cysteine-rich CPCC